MLFVLFFGFVVVAVVVFLQISVFGGVSVTCCAGSRNQDQPSGGGRGIGPMSSSFKRSQRKFIIFDRPDSRTRAMFGTISPVHFEEDLPLPSAAVKEKQPGESSTSKGHKVDEIHEDTEEIDALLYSDSEEEEEVSSGYHPATVSDVVSSSGSPVKKRRLNDDGASLQDTASSSCSHDSTGVDVNHIGKEDSMNISISIHETLGILRRIIPDGAEGKNPTRIIDEAISYLTFLKGCI